MFIVGNSDKSSFKFHVLQFKLFLSGQTVFINVIIKYVMHVDVRLFEHYITSYKRQYRYTFLCVLLEALSSYALNSCIN